MNTQITICDFGTAPAQKKEGYKLTGFEICCHESELTSLLRFAGDVRVVRGGETNHGEETFFVMVKCEDSPVQCDSITTIDEMVSKVKQEVANLEVPTFKINLFNFSNGERAIILAELTKDGYSAYCNETTLKCSKIQA